MDAFQLVSRALASRLGIDLSEISLDTELMELGVDSLDSAELLMELEEKLGIEIEASKQMKTVRDVVNEIDRAAKA
ncbi:MAG: acyl carrier protein [Thermoguttaceae bacterium]|nr:acyl carrier protein [Thermoguttaceae bacterium]